MAKTQRPHAYAYWYGTSWDDPQQRTGATGVEFTIIRGKAEVAATALLESRLSAEPTLDEFRGVLRELASMLLDVADAPKRIFRQPPPAGAGLRSS